MTSKQEGNISLKNIFLAISTLLEFLQLVKLETWTLLFSAELKPHGYYLKHVFYLDHVNFTKMSHVYFLPSSIWFVLTFIWAMTITVYHKPGPWALCGLCEINCRTMSTIWIVQISRTRTLSTICSALFHKPGLCVLFGMLVLFSTEE